VRSAEDENVEALSDSESDCLEHLDDAEATTLALAQERIEGQTEVESLQEAFNNCSSGIKGIMKLSFFDSIRWNFGWRPSVQHMGERVFTFMDTNSSGQLPMMALDVLVRNLEGSFHVSKDAFDMVEVLLPKRFCMLKPERLCQMVKQDLHNFVSQCEEMTACCELTK
jgi:hypothetical protein